MTNAYDVVLNLIDGSRLYEFFEWNPKDNIEEIEKIPLIRVDSKLINDLQSTNIIINKEFLTKIYKKTEVIEDFTNEYIEYACLFSNTEKTIAIEFNKKGESVYKSNLLLDEEEDTNEIAKSLDKIDIDYKVINSINSPSFITRNEEHKIKYLINEITSSYQKEMYSKINYLYGEIFKEDNSSIKTKYKFLIDDLRNNYNENHNKLIKILKLSNKKKKV